MLGHPVHAKSVAKSVPEETDSGAREEFPASRV